MRYSFLFAVLAVILTVVYWVDDGLCKEFPRSDSIPCSDWNATILRALDNNTMSQSDAVHIMTRAIMDSLKEEYSCEYYYGVWWIWTMIVILFVYMIWVCAKFIFFSDRVIFYE